MAKCVECEAEEDKLYEDIEHPPVMLGPCLCSRCYEGRLDMYVAERLDEITHTLNEAENEGFDVSEWRDRTYTV